VIRYGLQSRVVGVRARAGDHRGFIDSFASAMPKKKLAPEMGRECRHPARRRRRVIVPAGVLR